MEENSRDLYVFTAGSQIYLMSPELALKKKKKSQLTKVAHAYTFNTWEAEARGLP